MTLKDLKYLCAYIIPMLILYGLWQGGFWIYFPVMLAFVLVPIIEMIFGKDTSNTDSELETLKTKNLFFDGILYLNILLVFAAVILAGYQIQNGFHSLTEIPGVIFSTGLLFGSTGINVAHEIGHREGIWNEWVARLLLLPSHYYHFTIEHNFGHHKYVGTIADPATARKGESLYEFWFRSSIQSYRNAWRIETKRLHASGNKFWSIYNKMLIGLCLHITYNIIVLVLFGWATFFILSAAGILGFLLLETINYIEHYGLTRQKLENGHYEKVGPEHSWNSDHILGRILLYELTRHSDHHYKANKKYPVLKHIERSPQLPYGYPLSMIIAMIPPLWFYVMDKEFDKLKPQTSHSTSVN